MFPTNPPETRNVGFVSSRISGTDGVSLEIGKWAAILERCGSECFYVCGKSDRPEARTHLIGEASFLHPEIREINGAAFGCHHRSSDLSSAIHRLTRHIKEQLYKAIDRFQLELLIAQNALTIPLNIPLGAALVEVIIESGIPCIAHHHDFVWERERFLINSVDDYIHAAFPPPLAEIEHVVINSLAGEEFGRRTGLAYRVIPNVMDFANPPPAADDFANDFRESIGVAADDLFILQPTRIVQRKGIEHSIELVRRLDDPRCKLVLTHDGVDEGDAYPRRVRDFAALMGVEVIFADDKISDKRSVSANGAKRYSIWDAYRHADLVTYPSTYEGFGNAFLEAAYFKKPIFCNRYTIFQTDIEPCGIRAITMDGFLTPEVVEQVRHILYDRAYRNEIVEQNYKAASACFSFERAEAELVSILRRPQIRRPCRQIR